MWYGPLMMEHDAKVLQRPMPPEETEYYSWQKGGTHKFFYMNYENPLEMTVPFVGGFEIVKLWDEHRDAAEMASRVFYGKPVVCESYEQVSDDVDLVFLADCNYDGSDHLTLARPGLEKGVATYVDKPFADTVAHANEMIALARSHKAPLFSLSILRAEPAVARFRSRLAEVGRPAFATIQGAGFAPAGLVHTISTAQALFGTGIRDVRVMESGEQIAVHLDWGKRPDRPPQGVMINTNVGRRRFTVLCISAYGNRDDIHATFLGDLIYADGTAEIIRMIASMVETREVPPLMDEVLESIAAIQAAQESRRTGYSVPVSKFLSNTTGDK
ncbi:MAG TPA: Gfo/Idh/MocA family oxidoreductase [Tepidisphaeraceae bacterium]|nr:Gfo/Idh/MocA family oxidoreductase [Tepidisphaeraceae bacterium]